MKFGLLATAVTASTIFEPKDWAMIYKEFANHGFEQEPTVPTSVSTWHQCPDDLGVFHFTKMIVNPEDILAGQRTSYEIQATLDSPITVQDVIVDIVWNNVTVWSLLYKGGHYTNSFDFKRFYKIDASAPKGNYGLSVLLYD